MLKPLIITGLAFAFIGCASTSSQTVANTSEESKKVAKDEDGKPQYICQKTHQVGSNFKKLQCWTKEEYATKQQRDKEEVQRLQGSSMSAPETR